MGVGQRRMVSYYRCICAWVCRCECMYSGRSSPSLVLRTDLTSNALFPSREYLLAVLLNLTVLLLQGTPPADRDLTLGGQLADSILQVRPVHLEGMCIMPWVWVGCERIFYKWCEYFHP